MRLHKISPIHDAACNDYGCGTLADSAFCARKHKTYVTASERRHMCSAKYLHQVLQVYSNGDTVQQTKRVTQFRV